MADLSQLAKMLIPSGLRASVAEKRLGRDYGIDIAEERSRIVVRSSFGDYCRVRTPTYIVDSSFGNRTYVEYGCRISRSSVGSYSSIAQNCQIGLAEHPSSGYVSTHPIFYRHDPGRGFDFVTEDFRTEMLPTTLGSDVWIGASTLIKAGVTIGDGAVIGAGAVVTRDVEPFSVSAGVPARHLRYRFDHQTVDRLLQIRWWDWEESEIRKRASEFREVATFLRSG